MWGWWFLRKPEGIGGVATHMVGVRRLIGLCLLVAACGGSTGEVTTTASPSAPVATLETKPPQQTVTPPRLPEDVDLTKHSVPLEDVFFDTFDGGSVRLSDSTPELRARLLDAIPPIDNPVYETRESTDWLSDDDLVVGYVAGEQPYAYPFRILNFHEIVNDELDGIPVLVSYCPLCRSAVVYDRRVDGTFLTFGNTSALYESDLVMVDRQTSSYWWQVAGESIVGELTGMRLEVLPSSVATWADWATQHPNTLVLSRDTGFPNNYSSDPFLRIGESIDNGSFPFPVGEAARDARLAASNLVVGVEASGIVRVYPVSLLSEPVNDRIGDLDVLLVPGSGGANVFSPIVDGTKLHFNIVDGVIEDDETASTWDAAGVATSGDLLGSRLRALPSRTTFWFAMVAAFPDAELWLPGT